MTSVILHPINSSIYTDTNTDPQYVTAVDANRAIIYMDSQDCKLQTNKVNLIFSTVKNVGQSAQNFAYNISRVQIASAGLNYIIPNVNPRNNVITFYSSTSGLFHTVTLTEGIYDDPDDLIDHIVTQLNSVGASGLTFNRTNGPIPGSYYLDSIPGNYYFKQDCLACKYGEQLYGLPTDETPTSSKIVGYMRLLYTRYIDFCSNQLTQYAKIRTTTTGSNTNIVTRLFVGNPSVHFIAAFNPGDVSYNYMNNEPLVTIDMTLRDQFGQELYIPPNVNGFFWDINLIIEA